MCNSILYTYWWLRAAHRQIMIIVCLEGNRHDYCVLETKLIWVSGLRTLGQYVQGLTLGSPPLSIDNIGDSPCKLRELYIPYGIRERLLNLSFCHRSPPTKSQVCKIAGITDRLLSGSQSSPRGRKMNPKCPPETAQIKIPEPQNDRFQQRNNRYWQLEQLAFRFQVQGTVAPRRAANWTLNQ